MLYPIELRALVVLTCGFTLPAPVPALPPEALCKQVAYMPPPRFAVPSDEATKSRNRAVHARTHPESLGDRRLTPPADSGGRQGGWSAPRRYGLDHGISSETLAKSVREGGRHAEFHSPRAGRVSGPRRTGVRPSPGGWHPASGTGTRATRGRVPGGQAQGAGLRQGESDHPNRAVAGRRGPGLPVPPRCSIGMASGLASPVTCVGQSVRRGQVCWLALTPVVGRSARRARPALYSRSHHALYRRGDL